MLELREGVADRFGQPFVQVADHLPELHQRAFHGAEFSDDVVGMPEFPRPIQFLTALSRGERALGPVNGLSAAGSRTEPCETHVPLREGAGDDR